MENYSATMDDVFHALANPIRRSVIAHLGRGPASIKQLAAPHALGLPTFLKHISVLEDSGLIETEKTGRTRVCKLKREQLLAAEKWFEQQRKDWEDRYANLDHLLIQLKGKIDED